MRAHRNLIPKLGLAAMLGFFLYGWLTVDPNNASGSPIEVLGLLGTAIMLVAILLTFATMFIAARRAHLMGSWPWFLSVIFFWPACYLYTLAVNRDEGRR